MSVTLDPEVAATLAAMAEQNGPPPAPRPIGDVEARRGALNAKFEWANNPARPIATDVELTDYELTVSDGIVILARWYRLPSSDSRVAVLYLHSGGMILGSAPLFDGPVSLRCAFRRPDAVDRLPTRTRAPASDTNRGPLRRAGLAAGHAAELSVDPDRIAVMGNSASAGPTHRRPRHPRAYIEVGQLDIFRDENITYAPARPTRQEHRMSDACGAKERQ